MYITAIEQKSESRFTVYADHQYLTILDREIIEKYHLAVGLEIEQETLAGLFHDAKFRKARQRALFLLKDRAYTAAQLLEKVSKTNEPEIAREVICFLEKNGLVNDRKYIEQFAYEATAYKKWGREKIFFELRSRGIGQFEAEDALADFTFNNGEMILFLCAHKFHAKFREPNGQKKVIDSLYKMGYPLSETKEIVQAYVRQEIAEPEMDETELTACIVTLIRTKYARKLQTENGMQKVFAALCRRGYRYAAVKNAMQVYINSMDDIRA